MRGTPLSPKNSVYVKNASRVMIPPRSIVVATDVTTEAATETQDALTTTSIAQYSGQAGNILVTGSAPIMPNATGRAFYDQLIFVAIEPGVDPPTVGEEWGPKSGQWYVTSDGEGFFCHGFDSDNGAPGRAIFYRQPPSDTGGGTGGGSGCGCCDCYSCISEEQTWVGNCGAAPSGAPYQYELNWGPCAFSDDNGTSSITTLTYCTADCSSAGDTGYGSSSSSSSSSDPDAPEESDCDCSWYSCSVRICAPAPSGGSSSSSSVGCGVYQLRMDLSQNSDEFTVAKVYIVFLEGDDWMDAGE